MSLSARDVGLIQVKQNLFFEPLGGFANDGSARPLVAEGWSVSADKRVVTIRLRPKLTYQDGTPLMAADVVSILKDRLPRDMGPAFSDIDDIRATSGQNVEIRFRQPSGFRLELLEVAIQKPGHPDIGTGPYMPDPNRPGQLLANPNYYLGKPAIGHIAIQNYPSFRAAWADMLRGRTDMLYEVGVEAIESLRAAKSTAHVFTFPKRYQYLIALNRQTPALEPPTVRQALNYAIDREALVREALNGHGEASIGPVAPKQWAIAGMDIPRFGSDPQRSVALLRNHSVRFTCLVFPDYERIALDVKRQLEKVGVEMVLEEVSSDQLLQRLAKRNFDAVLLDAVSGPTMYRLYRFWHSGDMFASAGVGGPALDAALDEIRHSASDDEYREGVMSFIKAAIDDPPAIFLAWSEGARAVSGRFAVPSEPDRQDPMATLRLWRLADNSQASPN